MTGTEWEFEDALKGFRASGKPDIVAFRNVSDAALATADPVARALGVARLDALDVFWSLHFASKGKFIGGHETYQTLERFDELIEIKLRGLIERRIAALETSGSAPAAMRGPPFRGLRSYDFEDSEIYSGRDGLLARAIERLAARAHGGLSFLLVSGPSGSGKSSLVKAAMAPRLMNRVRIDGAAFPRLAQFRPSAGGKNLFLGLAEALTRDSLALPELMTHGKSADDLAAHLRANAQAPGFVLQGALGRVTKQCQDAGELLPFERAKLILIIDQLEEIVTVSDVTDDDRSTFALFLSQLAKAGDVWIVATLRDDFWPQIAKIADFAKIADGEGRLDVASPSPAEIAEIILRPAELAGLIYEMHPTSHLRLNQVLAEEAAAEPGVLPLLSFTLEALYTADVVKAGGTRLTFGSYDALGGLKGAIATRAEKIFAALPAAARVALPRVLRALTAPGRDAASSAAQPAPLSTFPAGTASRQLVDALLAERLLVASSELGVETIRLAHEALVTRWGRAQEQVTLDRRDLDMRSLIESQFVRWKFAAERDKDALLLHDPDLASARELERRWRGDLNYDISQFIETSARAAGRATVLRWTIAAVVIAALTILTVASFGALLIAQGQRNDALVAQSKGLIRDSRAAVVSGDDARGLRLALASLPHVLAHPNRPFLGEGANALSNAYVNRREIAQFNDGDGELRSVVFSPNGEHLLAASESGTARIWSLASPRTSLALKASAARLYAAIFSPDGKRVVTAEKDGSARLWDATTGAALGLPMMHNSDVVSVAFSPDGSKIATGALIGVAKLWDGETGARVGNDITCGEGSAPTVAFSPDGKSILTASETGGARLWDAASQKFRAP